jgi:hypothetical protein
VKNKSTPIIVALLGAFTSFAFETLQAQDDEKNASAENPDSKADPVEKSAAPKMIKMTWLGLSAGKVPPPLSAQLGLPESFGLVVVDVVPDSPAAAAGLQRHDVLKMLDDQYLIDPGQFSTLVRSKKAGTEVALTLFRAGKEEKVSVTLAEHDVPEMPRPPHGFHMFHQGFGVPGQMPGCLPPPGNPPDAGKPGKPQKFPMQGPGAQIEQNRMPPPPSGGPQPFEYSLSDGSINRDVMVDRRFARLVFSSTDKALDIEVTPEGNILTVRDEGGNDVFRGAINTPEERKHAPADALEVADKLLDREFMTRIPLPGPPEIEALPPALPESI